MNSEKCKICTFDFKPGTLVDGKCGPCLKKYPNVDSMKEWKEQKNPELKETERVFEEKVQKVVDRKLKEIGILTDCECGKSFFKRSPSHKQCGNCKEAS